MRAPVDVPGLDVERGPPTRVPLRGLLVGLAGLATAGLVGLWRLSGLGPPVARASVAHLLLLAWLLVTLAAAMAQFVPVWTGVPLYSRRLASATTPLLAAGGAGLAAALAGVRALFVPAAVALVVGVGVHVANLGLTLASARPLDPVGRRFAVSLAGLGAVLALGVALVAARLGLVALPYGRLRGAHVAVGLLGVFAPAVHGAGYQLVSMVAGVEPSPLDDRLRRAEWACHPAGVAALVAGRLAGAPALALVGGAGVLVGTAAAAAVVGRRLLAATTPPTPTLRRYGLAVLVLLGWVGSTAPAWARAPLAPEAALGHPALPPLYPVALGLVVAGTLYHVVPFLVWLERYADRVGREPVPTPDDLYRPRLARAEFVATAVGLALLLAAAVPGVPAVLGRAGGVALATAAVSLAGTLGLVVREHGTSAASRRDEPDAAEA